MRATRNHLLQHLDWTHEWIERADPREDAQLVEEERAVAIYYRLMLAAENNVRREMTLHRADGTRPTTSPMEDELIDHWTMRSTRNYLLQHLNWTREWIERADLREDAQQVEEERAVAIYFGK